MKMKQRIAALAVFCLALSCASGAKSESGAEGAAARSAAQPAEDEQEDLLRGDFRVEVKGEGPSKTITITGYIGPGGDLAIPERIDRIPVTVIGEEAFKGCDGLVRVTIPDTVAAIGDWAFTECENLTAVAFPPSVAAIGRSAFSWCASLVSVTIPPTVASIGERGFSYCSRLRNVSLSRKTAVGVDAFPQEAAITYTD
ncbi:MAG: leucine-rich repeat domain-containing protein [Spirochaetaceae bacterium]|nr:leucine-rich repeat domain-containing protein [Spirochaetaceae bacterium]